MTDDQLKSQLELVRPMLGALRGCPQDPGWHAEGDVWTHTEMVRAELERIQEFLELPRAAQNVLRLSASVHDVGKPSTTVEEAGHIRAPGHSRRGAEMLQRLWWESGYKISAEDRRLVLSLVRYHARPLHGLDRLSAHVAGTSVSVECRLVAILAEADMRGRSGPGMDLDSALLQIELFREAARQISCFDRPYPWPSDHARWCFFQSKSGSLLHDAYDDRRFRVHLMCGLPGSGKSTLATGIVKDGIAVSSISWDGVREANELDPAKKRDQGRASQLFREELRKFLRRSESVVVDGTNLVRAFRSNLIDLCANYGAAVVVHLIDRDRATVFANNRGRDAEVPEAVIDRMAGGMELPDETEAHLVRRY